MDFRPAFPKLGNGNYAQWAARMKSLFMVKHLWATVAPLPAVANVDGPVVNPADDEQALGLIGLNVEDCHIPLVSRCNTAREAWGALLAIYQANSNARKLQLLDDFSNIRMERGESISEYSARAKAVADRLTESGEETSELALVQRILQGLPADYAVCKSGIKMQREELTLQWVTSTLLNEEQDIRPAKESNSSSAFFSNRRPTYGRGNGSSAQGTFGGGRGPSSGSRMESVRCYNCGGMGHIAINCTKPRQFVRGDDGAQARPGRSPHPRGSGQGRGRGQAQPTDRSESFYAVAKVATALSTEGSSTESGQWLLDSGATHHMTNDLSILVNQQPLGKLVHVANGKAMAADAVGEVVLREESDAGCELRLVDVLYCPELPCNLLSLERVDAHGMTALIGSGRILVARGSSELFTAHKHGRRYLLNTKGPSAFACGAPHVASAPGAAVPVPGKRASVSGETAKLWHRRYAHMGYRGLAQLVSSKMVTGICVPPEEFRSAEKELCEPCLLANKQRHPFPTSMHQKSMRPMALVHMDVAGPMDPVSMGGARYAVTFVDDFSRLSEVVTTARKADVPEIVRRVITRWENQSGLRLLAARSDNGGEYINQRTDDYFASKGVEHTTTVPYNPEQNGVAERLNRTLMDRVRAMLTDSGLPPELWAEAVLTANYIRNRSPAAGRSRTPWELFYSKQPDVAHMRVFGAIAYSFVPAEKRKKLDERARRCVFVGYEPLSTGYRLLLDGRIVVGRHVTFDEAPKAAVELPAKDSVEESEDSDADLALEPTPAPPPDPEESSAHDHGNGSESPDAGDGGGGGVEAMEDEDGQVAGPSTRRYPDRDRRKPAEWYKASFAGSAVTASLKSGDPSTLAEALASPEAAEWLLAMDEEMASLEANGTWSLVPRPSGIKPISAKWVFKTKRTPTGEIERDKARLVARGFQQREGIDFDEVFAPVVRYDTLRAFLAMVAMEDLELVQLDVKTAFLNGELEEEVYLDQPPGFSNGNLGEVCHLHKALYGLRQAPRA